MSYRCGIGWSLAALTGELPSAPRITCDGCGLVWTLRDDRPPPSWFLKGRAPPGWKITRSGPELTTRDDHCGKCKNGRPSE